MIMLSSLVYSKETVKIVISASPGGSIDKIGRAIQTQLNNDDYTFVIEYKLGAGGLIATNYVAEEKHTPMILVSSMSFITNTNNPQAKYNIHSDFSYARCMIVEPVFIVVNGNSNIKTYNDFVKASVKQPMPYSTIGSGSAGEIIAKSLFKSDNYFSVPFKGGPDVINAVLSDTVVWTIESVYATKQLAESGRLKPIAVNSDKRLKNFTDVPTFKELGLNDKGFKRLQLVAFNSAINGNLKQYIINKINDFSIEDENVLSCSANENFIEEQMQIYKNTLK